MTSPERFAELQKMRREFYENSTTDKRRVEILTQVRTWAEEELPQSRCVNCKRGGIDVPYEYALIEGHCYSEAGSRDYQRITNTCEYCFDKMCKEADPEDDSIPLVGPRR